MGLPVRLIYLLQSHPKKHFFKYLGLDARNPVFGGLRTTQVQTSLRIRAIEISIFQLVSVAEETGLKLALTETPKTGFLAMRPILKAVRVLYTEQLMRWKFFFKKSENEEING